jgi:hypothetical protein
MSQRGIEVTTMTRKENTIAEEFREHRKLMLPIPFDSMIDLRKHGVQVVTGSDLAILRRSDSILLATPYEGGTLFFMEGDDVQAVLEAITAKWGITHIVYD